MTIQRQHEEVPLEGYQQLLPAFHEQVELIDGHDPENAKQVDQPDKHLNSFPQLAGNFSRPVPLLALQLDQHHSAKQAQGSHQQHHGGVREHQQAGEVGHVECDYGQGRIVECHLLNYSHR